MVLQTAINANEHALTQQQAEAAAVTAAAVAAVVPAAGEAEGTASMQQRQQQQQGVADWTPSPAFQELLLVYIEYVRRLRARVTPGGALRPLHAWEERYPPNRELFRLSLALRPEESLVLLMTNLVSGLRCLVWRIAGRVGLGVVCMYAAAGGFDRGIAAGLLTARVRYPTQLRSVRGNAGHHQLAMQGMGHGIC